MESDPEIFALKGGCCFMYTCANCGVVACTKADRETLPKNCPIRGDIVDEGILEAYALPENNDFYITASVMEKTGYGLWPRLKEIGELCRSMGYQKIGLAFCLGLHKEAKVIEKVLASYGLQVVSVICKAGGISKERAGIPEDGKLRPGQFEPMCNSIGQARLLNEQKTEFNIVVGLCVGHDSLFYKYSDALVTTLITKDRALAHNPIGAVYCAEGYFKKKLAPDPLD